MRVSTNTLYGAVASAIAQRQAEMEKTGQRITSGQRIITPSDDPLGAARLVALDSTKAINDRLSLNQTAAKNALSQTESVLGTVGDTYTDIRSLLVEAGNGALSDSDRLSLATEIAARRDQLLGLANTQGANGRYLFAGFRETQRPFVSDGTSITYQGDDNRRSVQVAASRSMEVSADGASVFGRIPTGNGVFEANAAATNTGKGVVGAGTVVDATALDGQSYSVVFGAGGSTYDIVDAAGKAIVSGKPYTSGAPITVAGMQVSVTGTPAAGDKFSLSPSTTRSVFDTLDGIISQLKKPTNTDTARQQLSAVLSAGIAQIDNASEKASLARAESGSALKELDTLDAATSARDLELQKQISELRDVDYTKAISDLSQRQTVLSAAQQSYAKIVGKTLFDYL